MQSVWKDSNLTVAYDNATGEAGNTAINIILKDIHKMQWQTVSSAIRRCAKCWRQVVVPLWAKNGG